MNSKTSNGLMVGGGALMLIAFVLGWTKAEAFGVSETGDNPIGHYFFTGGIAWIVVVAVGVLGILRMTGKLSGPQNWGIILAVLSILGALLMVIQVLMGANTPAEFEALGIDDAIAIAITRGPGMYVGLVAAVIAAAGGVMGFTAGGGDLKDLTDIDKLKGAVDDDPNT